MAESHVFIDALVPEGRLKIARRFNAGTVRNQDKSRRDG
jgi:hypothetical protein